MGFVEFIGWCRWRSWSCSRRVSSRTMGWCLLLVRGEYSRGSRYQFCGCKYRRLLFQEPSSKKCPFGSCWVSFHTWRGIKFGRSPWNIQNLWVWGFPCWWVAHSRTLDPYARLYVYGGNQAQWWVASRSTDRSKAEADRNPCRSFWECQGRTPWRCRFLPKDGSVLGTWLCFNGVF